MTISRRGIYIVILLIAMNCSARPQPRAEDSPTVFPQNQATPTPAFTPASESQHSLNNDASEIAALKARLETITTLLGAGGTFFALLLSLGTGFSIYGFIRSEKRATQAHEFALTSARKSEERAIQAFNLSISGETAAQNRAADIHLAFLSESKETLGLVNDTLTLAKEASERAAKMIEKKARTTLGALDKESKRLLGSIEPHKDRALIEKPERRSDLRSLAHKINNFETNRFILLEDIHLTPHCLFIKAMDLHLDQQYNDAIENWENVALSESAPDYLKSLAYYWIGYEQNNLGWFDKAELSFGNALRTATGIRAYELKRIQIESRFFNKKQYKAVTLIKPLEQLYDDISRQEASDERDERTSKIIVTLANVLNETGRNLKYGETPKPDEAREKFERARTLYAQVAEREKWANFGYAEMLFELGMTQEAIDLFQNSVRLQAQNEYVQREEPRTKVLARTTELICCLRVPDFVDEIATMKTSVLQELSRVDERLTVYSQFQKRNVKKEDFPQDLDAIMSTRNS